MSKNQVRKSDEPSKNPMLGTNPKDIHGYKKVDVSLLPSIAMLHGGHAMMDGARKYGPYNWRDNAVLARVYIAAAVRHINYWASGEELADDSSVPHLGHAIACLAILLDAQATGNLIDDRVKSEALIKAMKDLDAIVKTQAETRAKNLEPSPPEDVRGVTKRGF
jgi:hypothetical protein